VGLRACLVRLCRWCGGILDRDERGEELGYLEGENLVFVREEGRGKREEEARRMLWSSDGDGMLKSRSMSESDAMPLRRNLL
jgi:hypothetical protein